MPNRRFNWMRSAGLLLTCLIASVFLTSCGKDKLEFSFTKLNSGISNDLNHIFFVNDSVGYACGGDRYFKGDLLKTTDGGFTWQDQSTPDMIKALYHLCFTSPDTGYCCGYDGKIFKTFDGGNNWQYMQTDYYKPLHSIFMFDGEHGFACGGDGYKSGYILNTSSGEDWNSDTSEVEYRDLHFFNEVEGVMCGYGLILHTDDGGVTWNYTNAKQDFFVALDFVNEHTGFAIGYTGSIWKTEDGGQNWDRLRNSNIIFKDHWYLNCLAFRDANTGYIAGEGGCFFKTTDGGESWHVIDHVPDADWKGISLVSNGGFLCGTNGAIYRFIE